MPTNGPIYVDGRNDVTLRFPNDANRRSKKPPTWEGRPLSCYMPAPGIDFGPQRWQAKILPVLPISLKTETSPMFVKESPELLAFFVLKEIF